MTDPAQNVFLVDDDDAVRDSLSLLIGAAGYRVSAYAGADAFLAATIPEIRGCAVIDVRMPGMGGIRLQEEMSRRGYRLPIIFLTGHGDSQTCEQVLKAGAVGFLSKPVAGAELLRIIAAALAAAERKK